MPALTRKAKRRHFDPQEEEEGSENEAVVGILDRRAARRQAAQEAEKERQRQQVHVIACGISSGCFSCSSANIGY